MAKPKQPTASQLERERLESENQQLRSDVRRAEERAARAAITHEDALRNERERRTTAESGLRAAKEKLSTECRDLSHLRRKIPEGTALLCVRIGTLAYTDPAPMRTHSFPTPDGRVSISQRNKDKKRDRGAWVVAPHDRTLERGFVTADRTVVARCIERNPYVEVIPLEDAIQSGFITAEAANKKRPAVRRKPAKRPAKATV